MFDVVISCGYFRLPPHPRRIEVVAPLTQVSPQRLAEAAARWRFLVERARSPHIMMLVGGATRRHDWNAGIARRLGEDARAFAQSVGGSLFAVTSRRTGEEAAMALQQALGDGAYVHHWRPDQQENPYLAYLALADVLIVTGESESMLAEAATTGKMTYIYPLPELPLRPKARRRDWVVRQAYPPESDWSLRSSPRWALAKFCQALLAYGVVRPRRDLHALHQALIRRGVARFLGEPFHSGAQPPLREVDEVALRVRELLGLANK
jgi:mitochondrial fission protein ELM1